MTKSVALDVEAEGRLDESIYPCADSPAAGEGDPPRAIFLTGGSGFLGSCLLHRLLKQTDAQVYCLVRAGNAAEGRAKLKDTLKSRHLWQDDFEDRIFPVPGTLSKAFLGFSEESFSDLAAKTDRIYHCGAQVNFGYPYKALKTVNVGGLQEILRLSVSQKNKSLHYVSTVGVFLSLDRIVRQGEVAIREDDDPFRYPGGHTLGYTQSKLVAERLVTHARSRGIAVSVYRPGLICGHSVTGIGNPGDFPSRLLGSCIRIGLFPDLETIFRWAPVDYVADAICALSLMQERPAHHFHLVNPEPFTLSQLFTWLQACGYPLQKVPYSQWRETLVKTAKNSPHAADTLIIPALDNMLSKMDGASLRIECHNTLNALENSHITCPPMSEALLQKYLSVLLETA